VPRAKNLIDGMTQDEAREKIYHIAERNGYRFRTDSWIESSGGKAWPEMDQDHYRWITETLLPRHSGYEVKRGDGIIAIVFGMSTRYPAKRGSRPAAVMYAKRIDGTLTDVSWRECLKPANQKFKTRNAMRNAIRPQIAEFRMGKKICSECRNDFPAELLDVDHFPKRFEDLAREWLDLNGKSDEQLETCGMGDFEAGDNFVSPDEEMHWQDFHQFKAGLRMLCRECHRKAPR